MWTFSTSELERLCRDLATSELGALPGLAGRLQRRLHGLDLDLRDAELALDSLNRVRLATAAATWFNAIDSGHADLFLARSRIADWPAVAERARREGAAGIVFSTSGTSGERKHLLHHEATLLDEATAWAALLPTRQRVVVQVPVHHLYGFIWGLLLPRVLGVPVVDATLDEPVPLQGGDLVIGVPASWAYTVASYRSVPRDVIAISSTAPLPADLHRRLLDAGWAGVWSIYGSTETGGVGARTTPDGPYRLAPNRWRVDDDRIAHRGPDGTDWQVDLPDELDWEAGSDTLFRIGARRDGVVQVGGHNVDPGWVAMQIRSVPGVADAAVRLDGAAAAKADARLKVFVVLEPNADLARIEAAMREHLPWYACPQRVTVGDAVPVNAMGKRVDWG